MSGADHGFDSEAHDKDVAADKACVLTDEDCDRLFASLASFRRLLVAVSGGVDSTLLLVLLHRWCRRQADHGLPSPALSVAVVDHGLRSASAREADSVVALAARVGVPAAILPWQGEKPVTGLQAAAREARYALLADHARNLGADGLVLAHHADDQAETILMRLCAGSGLDGLAGMSACSFSRKPAVLRPLLSVGKSTLRASARHLALEWHEDPSNTQDRFTRVRFRKAQVFLAEAGLDRTRLNRLGHRLARARSALEALTETLWQGVVRQRDHDIVVMPTVFDAPDELQIRLLMKACLAVVPDAPQRLERFERLQGRLSHAFGQMEPAKASLAGCLLRMSEDGTIRVSREPERKRGRKSLRDIDKSRYFGS